MGSSEIGDLVATTQAVFKSRGATADFRQSGDIAMCRHEVADRHIEIVVRGSSWTVSYLHLESKKSVRFKGTDRQALEKALRPLCADTAFEPEVDESRFRNR